MKKLKIVKVSVGKGLHASDKVRMSNMSFAVRPQAYNVGLELGPRAVVKLEEVTTVLQLMNVKVSLGQGLRFVTE